MNEGIINKIITLVQQIIINNIIRILENFVSKDYKIWFFGMDGGVRFSGNVLYLYEYVKKNHPEIRTMCLANTEFAKDRVLEIGGDFCTPNSLKSFITSLKAGVYVLSYEMAFDFLNFSKKNTYKINLWHGVPLKKIQYGSEKIRNMLENKSLKQQVIEKLVGYVKHEEYDFLTYTSGNFVEIMTKAFNNKNVYLTGNPRDDVFFKKINRDDILKKYQLEEAIGKIIITYLPTFRDIRKNDEVYFIFENSPSILEKTRKSDLIVLQKNHQSKIKIRINKGNVYNLIDGIETQELLYVTDILITDYSSCYIDFLHTLRPIIFYPYDLKEYISKDRELYFDYNDEVITPGIKAQNEYELFSAIEKYVKDPQLDIEKRKKSLQYFQKYSDGRTSERVYKAIINIINEGKGQS